MSNFAAVILNNGKMNKIVFLALLFVAAMSSCAQEKGQKANGTTTKSVEETSTTKDDGMTFIDLAMNDDQGKERKLSEWCGKGNYVLIDFWASWCGPCRMEMPNVVANYEKYHAKGFEVIGISFDNNETAWKNGVEALGMKWPQLSDLKGWKSVGASTYGIRSIPSNVLVDGEGKIVAANLRGEDLGAALKEIYGF